MRGYDRSWSRRSSLLVLDVDLVPQLNVPQGVWGQTDPHHRLGAVPGPTTKPDKDLQLGYHSIHHNIQPRSIDMNSTTESCTKEK